MTTATQFQQLCERAREAPTQDQADEFIDLIAKIGREWHDNSVDALIERSELVTEIANLHDRLYRAREALSEARETIMEQDEMLDSQRATIEILHDRLNAENPDPFPASAHTPSFDDLFASELMESVESLLTTQEAVVAALARLGAVVGGDDA